MHTCRPTMYARGCAANLDVLQPVVVDLLKALRHDADAAVRHRCQRGLGERLHAYKPLVTDKGLNDFA